MEDHGLELMSLLKDDRYCYDNWWKIGVVCMNSFEREFYLYVGVKKIHVEISMATFHLIIGVILNMMD